MANISGNKKWSQTTGANLTDPSGPVVGREFKIISRAGKDSQAVYKIVAVSPVNSNLKFTTVKATNSINNEEIVFPVYHNTRYSVPENQK